MLTAEPRLPIHRDAPGFTTKALRIAVNWDQFFEVGKTRQGVISTPIEGGLMLSSV